jgi:hypothetical protein
VAQASEIQKIRHRVLKGRQEAAESKFAGARGCTALSKRFWHGSNKTRRKTACTARSYSSRGVHAPNIWRLTTLRLLIRPRRFASCFPTLATKTTTSRGWGTQAVLQYRRSGSIDAFNSILYLRRPRFLLWAVMAGKANSRLFHGGQPLFSGPLPSEMSNTGHTIAQEFSDSASSTLSTVRERGVLHVWSRQ